MMAASDDGGSGAGESSALRQQQQQQLGHHPNPTISTSSTSTASAAAAAGLGGGTSSAVTWTTAVAVQNTTTSTTNNGNNNNPSNNGHSMDILRQNTSKKTAAAHDDEETHITSRELADMLVLAQYRYQSPSSSSPQSPSSSSSSFLWWPALKFNSHEQLHDVVPLLEMSLKGCVESRRLEDEDEQDDNNGNTRRDAMNSIKADVLTEILDGHTEVLLYLGRPLDEYKSASASSSASSASSPEGDNSYGIQIHDLIANLRQLEQHCFGKPTFFPSSTLYWDFHRAMDFATSVLKHSSRTSSSRHNGHGHGHGSGSGSGNGSGSGSGSGIGSSVTIANNNKFLKMASKAWDEYQDGHDQQQQQEDQEPSPILQPQQQQRQQQHHHHHRRDGGDADPAAAAAAAGSPMSNSVAAVSLADDSTAHSGSLMNGRLTQRRPYPGPLQPPLLTNALSSPVKKYESFDDVWHKHELDGWNRHLAAAKKKKKTTSSSSFINGNGDVDDDGLVYKAPNGYVFESSRMFQQYLNEAYDWTGPSPPKKPKSKSTRIDNMTMTTNNIKKRSSSRTSSRRRVSTGRGRGDGSDNEDDDDDNDDWMNGKSFGRFFDYLTTKGWSWWPAKNNIQGYTTYYSKPGCNLKYNKIDDLQLGVDYFGTEDEVLTYCRQHNIRPPPSPPKQQKQQPQQQQRRHAKVVAGKPSSASHDEDQMEYSSEEEEVESSEDEVQEAVLESSEDEEMEEDVDSGYETPTDQPTSPRDPGKPLSRSPGGSIGDSDGTAYDDDEERYEWKILWDRLKKLGWAVRKAPNKLEDWWWIRTGGEANGEMKRGLDYFASKEDVIAFCKQRDKEFDAGRVERKKQKKLKQQLTQTSHASNEDHTAKAKRGKRPREPVEGGVKSPKKKTSAKINKQKNDQESKQTKRIKKPSIPKDLNDRRHPCNDANLVVPPPENSAIWAQDPPLYDHALCLEATGIVYSGSSYSYHVGDTVHRYDTLQPFVQDFARRKEFILSNGSRTPNTAIESQFYRAVAYSFVPGMKSEWDTTRSLSQSEASLLLKKLGYSKCADGSWTPPSSMTDAGILKRQYPNLEALCGALYSLEDLVFAPGTGSRRHRGAGGLTNTQMMALRLSIAEPFEDEADQDDNTVSNSKSLEKTDESPSPKKVSSKKRRAPPVEKVDVDDVPCTPPQEADDEEDPHEALSPSKIKVVTFEHAFSENPAPWANENPEGGKWSCIFFDMGFNYQGGYYYLPNEEPRNCSTRFTAPSDIQLHLCRLGEDQYRQYLENLDESDRKRMKRYLNYGCVPGKWNDWRPIRVLTRNEIIQFLELLGFERSSDESWMAPQHLDEIAGRQFHSLKSLFRALRSIPELEERSGRRRRKNEEEVLNRYQVLALRLCIAEGLVSGSETSEKELESPHNGNDGKHISDEEDEDADDGDSEQQFYSPDIRNSRKNGSRPEDDRCISRGGRFEEPMDADTATFRPESTHEEYKGDNSSNMTPPDAKMIHDFGTVKSPTEVAIKESENFLNKICSHPDAWKFLMDLGCSYTSGRYRLPTEVPSSVCLDNQNLLVQYILENGVSVLNWDDCTLSVDQTRTLHTYLKSFHALKVTKYSPIHEPFKLAADERRIFECLQRLGFTKDGDAFHFKTSLCDDETTYTLEGVVNLIRTAKDLPNIGSPVKRRPTYGKASSSKFLSRVELLALRIWASKSDFSLPGFPDACQFLGSKSLFPFDSSQSDRSADGQDVAEQNIAASSGPEEDSSMPVDDIPADDTASFHDSWSKTAEDGDTTCREDPTDLHAMEEGCDTMEDDQDSQNSDRLTDSTPQASSKKAPPSPKDKTDGNMPGNTANSRMTEDESMDDDDDDDDDDGSDDFNVDGYDANRRSAFSHSLASLPVTQPEYDGFEEDDFEGRTGPTSSPGHRADVQHQTEEASNSASNSNSCFSEEGSSDGRKTVTQQLKEGVKSVWNSWNKSSGVTDSLATVGGRISSPLRKRKGLTESTNTTESSTATNSRKRSKRVSTTPTDLLAQFGDSDDQRPTDDKKEEESENDQDDDDNDDDDHHRQSHNNHVVHDDNKKDDESEYDDDDEYDPSAAAAEGGEDDDEFLRDVDFLHAEMIANGDVP